MNADDVIRSFIALPISDSVRDQLAVIQRKLKETGAHAGWVEPANIHLTIVFLGDVFASQLPPVSAVLEEAAGQHAPFEVSVSGLGFFGSERSPRVVWAGVEDAGGRLEPLQRQVAQGVRGLGLKLEDRPFRAHLTLGRVRSRRGVEGLTSLLRSARNTSFGSVTVDRILLMESRVAHQGVRYSALHESILKGAGDHGG